MHPEIEKLINMALADGDVTEKERAIILRKAEALGIDKDEVEMILEGKIAIYNKQANTTSNPKRNNEGDLKKCPACGATVQSFSIKCADCDHEFRNIEASQGISKFYETINKVNKDDFDNNYQYDQKIASIITNFPIPNTKEEIVEFMIMAYQEANKKVGWIERLDYDRGPALMKKTWRSKCEQLILKARFSMKDDKKTLDELEYYIKQLEKK